MGTPTDQSARNPSFAHLEEERDDGQQIPLVLRVHGVHGRNGSWEKCVAAQWNGWPANIQEPLTKELNAMWNW